MYVSIHIHNPPVKASKPYIVENDDEDADDFIADLFSYLDVAKGELQKLAEEWERVNVNAINDLCCGGRPKMILTCPSRAEMLARAALHDRIRIRQIFTFQSY